MIHKLKTLTFPFKSERLIWQLGMKVFFNKTCNQITLQKETMQIKSKLIAFEDVFYSY